MRRLLRSTIGSAVATYAWRNRKSLLAKAKSLFGSGGSGGKTPDSSRSSA